MLFEWFDARHATAIGITLADRFAAQLATQNNGKPASKQAHRRDPVATLLQRSADEIRSLPLNFYRRARLANSFKWRLVEKGVDTHVADEAAQRLTMFLSLSQSVEQEVPPRVHPESEQNAQALFRRARELTAQGAHDEAAATYGALLKQHPHDADTLNNLGAALCETGRFKEAEPFLRRSIRLKPKLESACLNLGAALRVTGELRASAQALRRATQLAPKNVDARVSLGSTLFLLGQVHEAKVEIQRALTLMPQHSGARLGMGQIAEKEGHFAEAEALYRQILEEDPDSAAALCAMIRVRRMTAVDAVWPRRLKQILSQGPQPQLAASVHFALGKFHDDVREFRTAFKHFCRANEIMKANAKGYDHEGHRLVVDDLTRVYTHAAIAATAASSTSTKPVFVVGMPRSGTTLVEQIIASHPAAAAAGELDFWIDAMHRHEAVLRHNPPNETLKQKLATAYLRLLDGHSADSLRVVDKAPLNADYLGVIHSVFPQARVIHVRRHPIDTCLSCYFQPFSSALAFTMDLSDLAHYYQQYHRLVTHWHTLLPPEYVLEVRYEDLISDQEKWTRKIIDFLDLEWDARCLDFHATQRTVKTASAWQVRQKAYRSSIGRWRSYERFIGPLQKLKHLEPAPPRRLTNDVAE